MKAKVLLILAVLLSVFTLNSQAQSESKYLGEIDLGYSIGTGISSVDLVSFYTTHGVKFNDYLSVGAGIGIDYYFPPDIDNIVCMPIYANIKGYLPTSSKVKPFASLDIGYGVMFDEYISGGVYISPSVGIKVNKLKIQFGYHSQKATDDGFGASAGAIQFKIGLMF